MNTALTYPMLADLCDRKLGMRDVRCPLCGPGRRSPENRKRRVLRIWHKEPGFASFCCARCGESGFASEGGEQLVLAYRAPKLQSVADDDGGRERRMNIALGLWTSSALLPGTLGWCYLARRGLNLRGLGDFSHVLRWNEQARAVITLMTDPVSNEPTGIHRTFLNAAGEKIERKMLGKQGVIRLSPNEEVVGGLGLTEGIEDGLSVLLSGWAPVWSATSAGAIERFPVLCGIESLTIFADRDSIGMKAAASCASRWKEAGRESCISHPKGLCHAA
jgi:hypothetical protein